jgi:hypothetical protein
VQWLHIGADDGGPSAAVGRFQEDDEEELAEVDEEVVEEVLEGLGEEEVEGDEDGGPEGERVGQDPADGVAVGVEGFLEGRCEVATGLHVGVVQEEVADDEEEEKDGVDVGEGGLFWGSDGSVDWAYSFACFFHFFFNVFLFFFWV